MPVSITATVTESLPVVTDQASGASMSASGRPQRPATGKPLLFRPHSRVNRGSFGVTSALTTKLGSA
jgi:hypothetical protein